MTSTAMYHQFLQSKRLVVQPLSRKAVTRSDINELLFPFQKDLVLWAIRKGRAAIFADTGLGKTLMQLEWARLIGERTLIMAPLSVARQTVREAKKLGIEVHYTRSGDDIVDGINITNYEMVEAFCPGDFGAVVLDESSILKALTGKTRRKLTEMFADTPYRLCCTATPAPNDIAEMANHAEFLGIMTRSNMLSAFFVHDDDGWRLRGHAEEAFYRWLASWGMSIKKPSDLGYSDDGFVLPELNIHTVFVQTDYSPEGQLFFTGLKGVGHRSEVRKATMPERVKAAAKLVNHGSSDQWIVWCGLNDESSAMTAAISDAVEVKGSDSISHKIDALEAFQDGRIRVLVTKPRIAGFGMNFQNAHKMAFVGLSDSWESYYQCIRRCWRFMQESPVDVYIVLSQLEDGIWRNIQEKERQATHMSDQLISFVQNFEKAELGTGTINGYEYETGVEGGDGWTLMLGDSVERISEIEDESIGLSVFSPPFMDLYAYTPTERDLGNSHNEVDFFQHFGYIIDELMRVTMPGRLCVCHTADVPAMLGKDGYIGLKDFPGKVIQAFIERGWIYHGRVTIDKNPQAQAIRTHSKALLFVQMRKDSTWSRPAIGDSLLVFRKDGDNPEPVVPVENGEMDNNTWIEWAHPIWYNIRETETLQYRNARGANDDKHICPLQLETIERCIRLWSNPGDLVLSPFAGIGSEGYQAVKFGRRFVGIELKPSYFAQAVANLREAQVEAQTGTLFAWADEQKAIAESAEANRVARDRAEV
ncbi:MAG TPA: DNA methyltransferase [Anaerolineae bacterium]|nr:DNA methyltransferase [Anaerolineae bacterium]